MLTIRRVQGKRRLGAIGEGQAVRKIAATKCFKNSSKLKLCMLLRNMG